MTAQTKKTSARRRIHEKKISPVDSDQRRLCIAEAAYYKAEKRGFEAGGEDDDWLEAEREFDEQSGGA